MYIGIPKELHDQDHRVALGTNSVAQLAARGHTVYVQTGAGDGAGFSDEGYIQAGATIAYSAEEVYKRAGLIARVTTPTLDEIDEMEPDQLICGFAHLSAASPPRMKKILDSGVTMVAWELLRDASGARPIARSMSEIGGRLVPQIAARLLESPEGKGTLLSGIPGLPPAEVTILGAGDVGFNAARSFAGMGAQVTMLDSGQRLAHMDRTYEAPGRIRLVYAYPAQIRTAISFADVFIGAIHTAGQRAPLVITEQMVKSMRPGSVIIDVSIDQGGCVETSRPTTLRDPTFIKHGVIHYCVPNFTALVARTASRALSNDIRPYLLQLAEDPTCLNCDPALRAAVAVHRGHFVNEEIARAHHAEAHSLEELS